MQGSIAEKEAAQTDQKLGRYQLMATLGHGGMGTIHLAVAGGLGAFRKLLVVKELRRDLSKNEKFVEMFLGEARLAARLNHANIVHTLEAGREDDRYFLAMEFLDGQTYSAILKRAEQTPRVTLPLRIQVLCEALSGLHYIHELCDYGGNHLQIVHRDVSPQNVFVTYDGQVKLLDFGIAKAADVESLTNPGVFKGKFAYASPEQVKGLPIDRRSDVFAAGVMLWEAVAMRRFAKGPATQESVDARILGTEPRLLQAVPSVEPLLAEICDKALHVDPDERYATAEEFRNALQTYLQVTGDTPSPGAISRIVSAKFSTERADMHRLIDAHLKQGDFSESMVQALRPSPAVANPDNANPESPVLAPEVLVQGAAPVDTHTIADDPTKPLPPRRERSDSEPPAAELEWPPGRLNTGRWFWLGIGSAAALTGFVLALTREPHDVRRHPPTQLQFAKAAKAAAGSAEPIHVEAQRLASWSDGPAVRPVAEPPREDPAPSAPTGFVEGASRAPDPFPALESPRRRDRLRAAHAALAEGRTSGVQTALALRGAAGVQTAPALRGAAGRAAHRREANRAKAAAAAALAAATEAAATPTPTPMNPPARAPRELGRRNPADGPRLTAALQDEARAGQDMRAFNNRGRRPIDIEDPFQ